MNESQRARVFVVVFFVGIALLIAAGIMLGIHSSYVSHWQWDNASGFQLYKTPPASVGLVSGVVSDFLWGAGAVAVGVPAFVWIRRFILTGSPFLLPE